MNSSLIRGDRRRPEERLVAFTRRVRQSWLAPSPVLL
jgi:hypothetical protein